MMSQSDPTTSSTDRSERRKAGKALRRQIPHSSHGSWAPAADRPDPISLLQEQDRTRLQQLVPIKYGRMSASPFAFLRGSAPVMAADLKATPVTGLNTVVCGDAHISNFGLFASPERKQVFDVNDFDESTHGPWEWDLKRLATSAVVAARENEFGNKASRRMAVTAAETYRAAMGRLSEMNNLEVWYYQTSVDVIERFLERMASRKFIKKGKELVRDARARTQQQAVKKLTRMEDGKRRIIHQPPLIESFRKTDLATLLPVEEKYQISVKYIEDTWERYLESLPEDRRMLLGRFRISDAALRAGGVGSVGTRCFIVLLESDADDEALILQLKEAGPSALAPYLGENGYGQQGERVVMGQQLMQASSDIFLGWHTSELTKIDYYWRQLKDMKGSAEVADMDEDMLQSYVAVCSGCLARAHARTGDAATIVGYMGTKNDSFPRAIADFAEAYADQTERDHQALLDAIESGRVVAQKGI